MLFTTQRNKILVAILIITAPSLFANADMLIFSYNRPLQLYALLESVHKYMTGIADLRVIYRADNDAYASGYAELQTTFPAVTFIKQGANPRADFKPLTLQALDAMSSPYIIFAVDDIVVKDYVDLAACGDMLQRTGAYGFYLRLGLHTDYCYALSGMQGIPQHVPIAPDMYAWQFSASAGDWNYPNTVDMTLFRKAEVMPELRRLSFSTPNSLEGNWAGMAGSIMQRLGLFFGTSKIVNLPFNLVQNDFHNRNMAYMTCEEFLKKFQEGFKIDISPLFQIKNRSAHMDYVPTFVVR